jgi:NAD(P)-dependent dehydrogenase (short-subunit alcohol dehydrogenase family)
MELGVGDVAVVTGAASGIGFALADRFAREGMHVVLADIEAHALAQARERIAAHGVEVVDVVTDVSDEEAVNRLAEATLARFGAVHVVCNNAGVGSTADAWFGPLSSWRWVLGVNLWGVVHGVRAFLPTLLAQQRGYIVNTASMAGLMPGTGPSYDASKHAVVALTEDLYTTLQQMGSPVGVGVLCPGWVRTNILDAERNWPTTLGEVPAHDVVADVLAKHVGRALDEGMPPAAVADVVAESIVTDRFWIFPHPEWLEIALRRWHTIAEGINPEPAADVPGIDMDELIQDVAATLTSNQ